MRLEWLTIAEAMKNCHDQIVGWDAGFDKTTCRAFLKTDSISLCFTIERSTFNKTRWWLTIHEEKPEGDWKIKSHKFIPGGPHHFSTKRYAQNKAQQIANKYSTLIGRLTLK